jgi:prepilin-type N-terminal cleavage/methylation domain-containing protein
MKKRLIQKLPRGFTILELLIVISIIAVLAGLVMPVLQSATIKAYDTKCANNLRQIGMAANAAAADNDNTYPLVEVDNDGKPVAGTMNADGSTVPSLSQALGKYGITKDVLICPLDAKDQKFYTSTMSGADANGNGGSSYMWQPYSEDDSSNTPSIIPRMRRGGTGNTTITQINIPTSRLQLCSDWIPEHLPSNVSNPTGARKMSYIVYADGHVRTGINSRNYGKK